MHAVRPAGFYGGWLLALFMLLIGIWKLLRPQVFIATVFHWHILPYLLVNSVAIFLMSLEVVAAFAAVLMPSWRRAGLWVLVGILFFYTGCEGYNLLRGVHTICGCFGVSGKFPALSLLTLIKHMVLLGIGLFALR
jgi:hypothetical protein